MKKFAILSTFVLFAMLAPAFAQYNVGPFALSPYAAATIATAAGMGTQNPDFTVGAGMEANTAQFLLDVHVQTDTADFNDVSIKTHGHHPPHCGPVTVTTENFSGANTDLQLQAAGYYKMTGRFNKLLVGGGATLNTNTASATVLSTYGYARQGLQPFVGIGYQVGKLRSIVTYDLPGLDSQIHNRAFHVNTEVRLFTKVSVTQATTIDSFDNGAGVRATGTSQSAGLKYYF